MSESIVFFDGECAMCNSWVQFVLKRDPSEAIKFISLHADEAVTLLAQHNITYQKSSLTTIYYLKTNRLFTRSNAILELFRDLDGFWKVMYLLKIIPTPIRDVAYRIVARYRHYLFKPKSSCQLLSLEQQARIME